MIALLQRNVEVRRPALGHAAAQLGSIILVSAKGRTK